MSSFQGDEGIRVDQSTTGSVVVLSVSGAIDMLTAPLMVERIDEALAVQPAALVIDLTGVEFLASVGLAALLRAQSLATEGSVVAVVADGPATRRAITLTGIDSIITLFTTLERALAELSG